MGKGFVNVSGGGGSEDKIKKLEEGLENHTHDKIVFVDDRNDEVTPENTTPGITVHLKNDAADGLNVGGSLHSVLTVRSWHDMTGPKVHELGFTDNGILAHRYSTGDGTWSEWSYVAHQYDLANCLQLSGGTMTGTLIQKNLTLFDGVHNREVIAIFDDGDGATDYGSEVTFQSGGNVFLGSGESPNGVRTDLINNGARANEPAYSQTGEVLYLTSDNGVVISTNANKVANRKSVWITNAGAVVVPANTDYGTYKARNVAAGTADLTAGSSALANGNIYLVYE